MAYLKNLTDNFFQIFFMRTSLINNIAVSINNIKTRATRETSKFSIVMGWTLPSTGMWRGEVFAISDRFVSLAMVSILYGIILF